ncbi:hypothetical protein Aperf_G00000015868 [Anoplocephala perfoliata]
MKIQTPEIAWHEVKPIYSCDLQPFLLSSTSNILALRQPFAELSISDLPSEPMEVDPLKTVEKITMSASRIEESVNPKDAFGKTWTRLATVGGDNIVRMWKVNLSWEPPTVKALAKTSKKPQPPEPGGVAPIPSGAAPSGSSAVLPANEGVKKVQPVAQGLVFLANLKRHDSNINVVRWSPTGRFLASGGDDSFIAIWHLQPESKRRPDPLPPEVDADEPRSVETWLPIRFLKGHECEILDLAWSPDEKSIVSGGVDKKIILYTLSIPPSGEITSLSVDKEPLGSHKHLVQGVAWDPEGEFVASLSNDRSCHIYRMSKKARIANISKVGKSHLFQDDSWRSFFRRMAFSPDGVMLICPSGNLEAARFAGDVNGSAPSAGNEEKVEGEEPEESGAPTAPANAPQHAAHIFRCSWSKSPCVSLPTGRRPVVAICFCPQAFRLRITNPEPNVAVSSLFDLPYRWIFCLVLDDGLLFYDTQQVHPFAQISDIHYQSLNDASWSSDGRLMTVTSTDGYCSLIYFSEGELGTPYRGPLKSRISQSASTNPDAEEQLKDTSPVQEEEQKLAEKRSGLKPLPKAIEELNPNRHISFVPDVVTPERTHKPIPVTPNAGRFLTEPIPVSPCGPSVTPLSVRSKKTGEKRSVKFVTLTEDLSTPVTPVAPPTASNDTTKEEKG